VRHQSVKSVKSSKSSKSENPEKLKLNLEESKERFISDLKEKLAYENFNMQRRKTYITMLRKETVTGKMMEKKQKNEQKIFGDHCSVCLDSFIDGDQMVVTPCNHSFHDYCLMDWVN